MVQAADLPMGDESRAIVHHHRCLTMRRPFGLRMVRDHRSIDRREHFVMAWG
jgi:hypothetical protein